MAKDAAKKALIDDDELSAALDSANSWKDRIELILIAILKELRKDKAP